MQRIPRAVLTALVLSTFAGAAIAQDPAATEPTATQPTAPPAEYKHSLYIEFGGNAIAYSINYDRMIAPKVSIRLGAGVLASGSDWALFVPVTLNYILGKGNNRIELGGGVTFLGGNYDVDDDIEDMNLFGTAVFAYRYQKPEGVFFKVALTPVFNSEGFIPWFGFSIGSSI